MWIVVDKESDRAITCWGRGVFRTREQARGVAGLYYFQHGKRAKVQRVKLG